jgi:hypothetical protein
MVLSTYPENAGPKHRAETDKFLWIAGEIKANNVLNYMEIDLKYKSNNS